MDIAEFAVRSSATVRYDEMCSAIAAAHEVDEVKDIRDRALAIEIYARQARNVEAETKACEIRLRAERRCGQMLREREMAKGTRGQLIGGSTLRPPIDDPQKPLADLGISKTQSSRWQRLAAIPEAEFEAAIAKPGPKPTTTGLIAAHEVKAELAATPDGPVLFTTTSPIAAAPAPKVIPVDDRALWLWGRLLDFERMGLLDLDPNDLGPTMLDHLKETTRELAPQVAAWLGRIAI